MPETPASVVIPTPAPAPKSPPSPISIPGPAAFGVTPAEDWTACLARLEKLGLIGLQGATAAGGWLDVRLSAAGTPQPGRAHRIESGPAATKTAALKLVLAEAERLATSR